MKRKSLLVFVLILVAALSLTGCAAAVSSGAVTALQARLGDDAPVAVAEANVRESSPVNSNRQQIATDPTLVESLQAAYEQVYEEVNPSVVNISVVATTTTPFPNIQGESEGLGSGFVWDTEGHIVTNHHVVEGARQIQVTFSDGETVDAELVGEDPDADLAVIRVDVPADWLHPVRMADSDEVKVGQLAIAIGNPFGLSGTMTEGIVSGLSRSLEVSADEFESATYTIPDIIQTDAAINPGNSGGVLVNIEGEVIGVTTAIRSTTRQNSGIGFVIPSNIVSRIVPELIETGSYEHPRLGISGMTLTRELAQEMGLDADQKGVLVVNVVPDGPADRAGLRGTQIQGVTSRGQTTTYGDVIIAIDGQPVNKFEDLTSYLFRNTQVGQTVTLTILRQGREKTVELTLSALPLS